MSDCIYSKVLNRGSPSRQTCNFPTIKLQCTKLSYHWYPKVVDLPFLLHPPSKKKDMFIKKIFRTRTLGFELGKLSSEYLQFKTLTVRPSLELLYWSCRYIFIETFVTAIAWAVSIRREITIAILSTFLVLLSSFG